MAHITANFVLETSTSTGTGPLALSGAVTGFQGFSEAPMAVGDTAYYSAWAVDGSGARTGDWEVGVGTCSAAHELTRSVVLDSSAGGAAVAFGAGTKMVALGLPASAVVQFNAAGAIPIPRIEAAPATISDMVAQIYSRKVVDGLAAMFGGNAMPGDLPTQASLHFARVHKLQATNAGIAAIGAGGAVTASPIGFSITPTMSSGSAKTAAQRVGLRTAATAGQVASAYCTSTNSAPMIRGAATGEGGFLFRTEFAYQTLVSNARSFVGVADVSSAPTNSAPLTAPSPGRVGIGFEGSTGNLHLIHTTSGSAPTTVDLGLQVSTAAWYELILFADAADSGISYQLGVFGTDPLNPTHTFSGRVTSNLPAAMTTLSPWMFLTNNDTAGVVEFQLGHWTVGSKR